MKSANIQTPKIVIFDLDGVLVDACEWHRIAFNQALEKTAGYIISEKDHIEKYNGLPTATKLKILNDENIIKPEDNILIHDLKQDLTIKLIEENIKTDQTKIELLKWLLSEGYKVACFTNSIIVLLTFQDMMRLLQCRNECKNLNQEGGVIFSSLLLQF